MPARLLRGRSAGMKNVGAFFRRQAGNFEFLESGRRHRGNPGPMRNGMRENSARFAKLSVGGIVLELQREQHDRHAVEFNIGMRLECGVLALLARQLTGANGDIIAHTRRKNRKFGCHAVFLLGWFSATAPELSTRAKAIAQELNQTTSMIAGPGRPTVVARASRPCEQVLTGETPVPLKMAA